MLLIPLMVFPIVRQALIFQGYSRVTNTIGCIVTTFGFAISRELKRLINSVGELSAAAGIAGSYCEYVY